MLSKINISIILLFIIGLVIIEGQECDCNYNAHCRTGSAFWCTSRNTCSGNCVGIGPWAYCRPNQWRCNIASAAPYGGRGGYGYGGGRRGYGYGGGRGGYGYGGGWGKKK